ncbi:exodeoxyribonuclease III [Candidatus Uhrbacteria bacterium CG10_big_fil_rev_8_21_14_0_10_48_16]|uniref:Exodeoxyribonuclease III n=1 Tax=Candidatus Uhrbacteria bacterium CG10_big_fil_rev_8_21_14_0_10_48_16 TaxID=1975038 RepID=A0A2M8LI71_9BACT|nr:MAG: exodeoxyribonuclease III [Candidatus Uhrbacteria bacterium CG10_big_fil_rev_8_21_14_0_10_48_16]
MPNRPLKLISWNVNGLRAVLRKEAFIPFVKKHQPDILCLQETKAKQGQAEIDLPEYEEIWNSAEKAGYAGTAIFTKLKPLSITYDIPDADPTLFEDRFGQPLREGRIITMEFEDFFLVTVYTPNAKRDLARLKFRHTIWDPAFLSYMKELEKKKPVVFCGDLNVAHKEIDLARPKDNRKNAGFTDEEREGADKLVEAGFIDTFRHFYPDTTDAYTWWSNFGGARARNVGWRIDYFFVSSKLKKRLTSASIHPTVMGSDHCPVEITLTY